MVAASHNYQLKSGKNKRYVSYVCQGARNGACCNHHTVPEEWLRQTIVDLILRRVFFIERVSPGESHPELLDLAPHRICAATLGENYAFQELLKPVQRELDLRAANRPERRHILDVEERECQDRQQSYLISLGKTSLPATVRDLVEKQLEVVIARLAEIEHELNSDTVQLERIARVATPEAVAENLLRLSEILAGKNVSAANLCLAQHIDSISCNSEGKIVV